MSPGKPSRSGVLCAGSLVVDEAKVVDAYPPLDGFATITSVNRSTGGPALNVAIDLRELGASFPIAIAGALGADGRGAFIRAECDRHALDGTGFTEHPTLRTAFTDAIIDGPSGRRTILHHPGVSETFDPEHVPIGTSKARILHAGVPGVHPIADAIADDGSSGWSRLFAAARALGMHTNLELASLAAARTRPIVASCLPHLDSLIINEIEAGALAGIESTAPNADGPVDWAAIEAMAAELIGRGIGQLVVIHFPAGCVALRTDGRAWRQPSVRVPAAEVRNATGAGDAFAAGVLFGLHADWSVDDCLRLAVASAAGCVRSPRTAGGFLDARAVLAAAERDGFRPIVATKEVGSASLGPSAGR